MNYAAYLYRFIFKEKNFCTNNLIKIKGRESAFLLISKRKAQKTGV